MDKENNNSPASTKGKTFSTEEDEIVGNRETYYNNSKQFWSAIPATVDGVLGGYGHVSTIDISGSEIFLKHFIYGKNSLTNRRKALDCGAGIGRITKHLLLKHFSRVDMLEINQAFLDTARDSYLGSELVARVDRFICCGLQEARLEPLHYDVVWCQWVLAQVAQEDIVAFLRCAKQALTPNGTIIIKENISGSGQLESDPEDGAITRPAKVYRDLIRKAGLKISYESVQQRFPKELYEVRMFGCRASDKATV